MQHAFKTPKQDLVIPIDEASSTSYKSIALSNHIAPSKEETAEKERVGKCVTFVFGVLPILIMIGIFLVFSLNDSLKLRVIGLFQHLKSTGINATIACNLLIYGALLVFVSFPYVIFEMSLGFTFPPAEAMFFAVTAKLIGEFVCFCLSRYLLKSCFLKFLRMNDHFIIIEAAVKKNPWTVSNLLRASILVPLFVINFGSGIINLTFAQYLVPALLWGTLYSAFAVLCGSQLVNISEVIENAAYPKNPLLFIFELSMLIISLVIIVAAIWKSGKIYESIKEEMKQQNEEEEMEKAAQSTKVESVQDQRYSTANHKRIQSTSFVESEDPNISSAVTGVGLTGGLARSNSTQTLGRNITPFMENSTITTNGRGNYYYSCLGSANINNPNQTAIIELDQLDIDIKSFSRRHANTHL